MSITLDTIQPQLSWLCDAMIPGSAELGMPSASAVGVQEKLLPRSLKARADLAPKFLELVATLPEDRPADPLAIINAMPVTDLDVIGRFIAGSYFSDQEVQKGLGYTGYLALPMDPDYDEIMATIEPIMERGPCYVQVPS
ncbi:hypothetical protein QBK93_33430 [Rhizobium leguminosarum]|uniref:hypothetical protein n=1 Tax=Rhizobium leguminosarum TaxID=384 RepID=UPI0024A7A8C3|nr:hypothetical protein [Rhizobium leguminosarum]MDI5929521.1 hypothetical protein [Rhizobium leguminosarum]